MADDFPSLRNEPLDVRLSAYLDGQTSDDEAAELEQLIAGNDEARALFDQLMLGSEVGNKAFDEMLREPVPLNLVRAIKDASAKAQPRLAANAPTGRSNIFSFVPRAIAASAILILAGGYTGYVIGNQNAIRSGVEISDSGGMEAAPGDSAGEPASKTRSFDMGSDLKGLSGLTGAQQLANQWQAFRTPDTDIGLVPAADAASLAKAAGVEFSAPDLSAEGWQLSGLRLMADAGRPMAGLIYRDGAGNLLIVGYSRLKDGADPADKTGEVSQIGSATLASAIRKGRAVNVIGQAGLETIETLRDKAIAGL